MNDTVEGMQHLYNNTGSKRVGAIYFVVVKNIDALLKQINLDPGAFIETFPEYRDAKSRDVLLRRERREKLNKLSAEDKTLFTPSPYVLNIVCYLDNALAAHPKASISDEIKGFLKGKIREEFKDFPNNEIVDICDLVESLDWREFKNSLLTLFERESGVRYAANKFCGPIRNINDEKWYQLQKRSLSRVFITTSYLLRNSAISDDLVVEFKNKIRREYDVEPTVYASNDVEVLCRHILPPNLLKNVELININGEPTTVEADEGTLDPELAEIVKFMLNKHDNHFFNILTDSADKVFDGMTHFKRRSELTLDEAKLHTQMNDWPNKVHLWAFENGEFHMLRLMVQMI